MIFRLLVFLVRFGLHMGRNNRGGRGNRRTGSGSRAQPVDSVDGAMLNAGGLAAHNRPVGAGLPTSPPDTPVARPEPKDGGGNGWDNRRDDRQKLSNLGNIDWGQSQHILYGDKYREHDDDGGHHHDADVPGKTHFPKEWEEQDIIDMSQDVARNPDSSPQPRLYPNAGWIVSGERGGVQMDVVLNVDGSIHAAYPTGGNGVYKYTGE